MKEGHGVTVTSNVCLFWRYFYLVSLTVFSTKSDLYFLFVLKGCPAEDDRVPLETKEFNMSEYLDAARAEDFIGRQWLYREIEDAFKDEYIAGVQILGSPGSGKSALSSHLICSRTSSPRIHTHIIGYHLCKYSDKNTQMAGKFVRNLADMIARRLPEYGYLVSNTSFIQRSFAQDCIQNQDPVGCFEVTIVTPLRNLKKYPTENWFLVVDALDECLAHGETGHSIVYLLNNKIHRLPTWFKLVLTSRNESDVSLHSSKINKITMEDSRNLEDLELYVTKRFQERPLLRRITSWFGDDSEKSIAKLAGDVLNISQGNFLFVKELLDYWELSRPNLSNAFVLPKTLGDLYQSYFERLFPRKGSFKYARHVFELLVSTFDPLTQKQILELLKTRENNLDEEYDFKNRLKELGHFLKYGKDNTVTLYHLSLTEWLTSEENEKYFVSKKKGHKTFCDFYLNLIRKGKKGKFSKYILKLAQHIALGGRKEAYVQEFLSLPSQIVNSSDPQSKGTLLHLAATMDNRDALELLLTHFTCIDCVDNRGITPAFLAAEHGLVDNVALLIGKGAKVNRKTKGMVAFYKAKILRGLTTLKEANNDSYLSVAYQRIDMPVYQTNSKFFGASMLHAAAKGGHERVVRFLIEKNARISILNGAHLNAMQIAAEHGHLNVVRTLYEAGAVADQTALHHAAANNRMDVVNFLLDIGLKDDCLRCDGFFYWLNSKHRFPSTTILLSPPFKDYCSHIRIINNDVAKMCIDYEKKWPDETKKLYDDSHLIFCHSALHAAVAGGHDKVVTRLLSENHSALNCHDYSGRTPLHEAVRKNDSTIVNILLDKHPQMVKYKCKHWQEVDKTLVKFEELAEYNADVCHCGYTPLHLAARYGHLEVATLLIRKGARLDERDCTGATPVHVAACHNHANLTRGNLNIKTSNGSTPLHSAAACGAVEVIDYLLDKKASLTAVDNYGLTALHYSIHNIRFRSPFDLIAPRKGHLSGFFVYDNQYKSVDGLRWLDTLVKLLRRGSKVDVVDVDGQTPLHIAAHYGLADAVNVLLQMNASMEMKDKNGKTPLEVAFENAPVGSEQFPSFRATKVEDLRELLHGHVMVIFLLISHGASSGKCTSSRGSMLHTAIVKKQFHIAQLLLLKGANLTCEDSLGRTPLITCLHNSGEFSGILFSDKITEPVAIECGKPFNYSLFHLLSYNRPFFEDDGFFYLEKCSESTDPLCTVKKSPLAVAVESHFEKERIINSCFDAEGFTALHRAAQGANLAAIRYLLAIGANDSTLSPYGHDALTLAVLHAERKRLWERNKLVWVDADFHHRLKAEEAAIELLRHAVKSRGYKIRCDASKAELTLYHLAASRGLLKFIEVIFSERDLHQLDVDCANADGITPMYLAKLFKQNEELEGQGNPWEQVIQIIKRHGGKMRYPKKMAEYSIIYNGVYGWIPDEFTLDLRPDIFHFITSLLKSFQIREKRPFHCSFAPYLDVNSELFYWPIKELWEKVNSSAVSELRHLEEHRSTSRRRRKTQYSREEESFRRDLRRCLLHVDQFYRYLSRIDLHRQMYPKKVAKSGNWEILSKIQGNWFQKELLDLMKMRHTEVFRMFSCAKSLFDRFKPLFRLNDDVTRHYIREYEKSGPDNYLNLICQNLRFIFQYYSSYRERNQQPSEYRLREYELFSRPDFVGERMKISKYFRHPGRFIIEWPQEFFLKRSLGFYRRYDYLKTLHIGIEPRTYVHLYPDNIRNLVERGKVLLLY